MSRKEKQKVVLHTEPLETCVFSGTIPEVIQNLYALQERLKQEHPDADGFFINDRACYDGIDPEVACWRWETDEEFEQRQKRSRIIRARQRKRQREKQKEDKEERALYEKLKAKFENA